MIKFQKVFEVKIYNKVAVKLKDNKFVKIQVNHKISEWWEKNKQK